MYAFLYGRSSGNFTPHSAQPANDLLAAFVGRAHRVEDRLNHSVPKDQREPLQPLDVTLKLTLDGNSGDLRANKWN